jgi:hypothetical protein
MKIPARENTRKNTEKEIEKPRYFPLINQTCQLLNLVM